MNRRFFLWCVFLWLLALPACSNNNEQEVLDHITDQSSTDGDATGNSDTDTNTDSDSYSNVDTDSDSDSYSNVDTDSNLDSDSYSNADTDSNLDSDSYSNVDTDSDSDSDSDADSDADGDSDDHIDSGFHDDWDTGIVLEENATGFCGVDGLVESQHTGFTGDGYVNTSNAVGADIEWSIELGESSSVTLTWTYAFDSDENRPGELRIDGGTTIQIIDFSGTGAWTAWNVSEVTVTLSAGNHTIRLVSATGNGLPNVDSLTIAATAILPGSCEDNDGTDTVESDTAHSDDAITIWIAGDSTVANGSSCPVGWGQWFESQFNANVKVVNRAIGGRSIQWWRYDVSDAMYSDGENRGECIINTNGNDEPIVQDRWAYMLENMKAGDYLLIQFGINDGDPACPRHVGAKLYQSELIDMAAVAQALGVHPIFFTPLSSIKCSGNKAVATRGFLAETLAAGIESGVPVIDLHQLSIDLYNSLSFCPLPFGWTDVNSSTPGEVGAFFCDDHTHLDTPGAQAIAQLIADVLEEQSIPLAAWIQ